MTHISDVIAPCPLVDVLQGEELCLSAGLDVNGIALLHIRLYQLISPPCESHVLRERLPIVGASEVQVLKGEELILCSHRQ